MEEHSKIKNLINFLKENNVGLSSEEITNTYIGFISCNNNLNDFSDYIDKQVKHYKTLYISSHF